MVLKVHSKQAYGINLVMKLCEGYEHECRTVSTKTGNSEVLFAQLRKNQEYFLQLEHQNSLIQLSSFFDCPHVHLRISMISHDEAVQKLNE
jgi:hypothetical protein